MIPLCDLSSAFAERLNFIAHRTLPVFAQKCCGLPPDALDCVVHRLYGFADFCSHFFIGTAVQIQCENPGFERRQQRHQFLLSFPVLLRADDQISRISSRVRRFSIFVKKRGFCNALRMIERFMLGSGSRTDGGLDTAHNTHARKRLKRHAAFG